MGAVACGVARDPLRIAGRRSDAAVEAGGELGDDVGPSGLAVFDVGAEQFRAAAAPSPSSTASPAARRLSIPRPRTFGSGSSSAITTRAMPASMIACEQGGVRLPGTGSRVRGCSRGSAPLCTGRGSDSIRFCVAAARRRSSADREHFAIAFDECANPRIRAGEPLDTARGIERRAA